MGALESAVEWLRPLVQTKEWEYCVVWKLGDDPSRFIEWMGCCCGGGNDNVKDERVVEQNLGCVCRDTYIEHPVRTKACDKLAKFPSFMPLYSGIHGEVAISNQPRWLTNAIVNASNSSHSRESIGTQVLVPVAGGLIELFTAKNVPKDQKIIDFVTSQYEVSVKHETMSAQSHTNISFCKKRHHAFVDDHLNTWPAYVPQLQNHLPVPQQSTHPGFEVSSSGSNPSNECPLLKSGGYVSQNASPNQSIEKPHCVLNLPKKKEIDFGNQKNNLKGRQKTEKERYHSKNLVTERNRRNRIKDGLFSLRALVPKISKMDRASILGDAIEYIEELQKTVNWFQNELKEMAEEDCKKLNHESEIPKVKVAYEDTKHSPAIGQSKNSSSDGMKQMQVQVEVNEIGKRDFLLKLICKQKRGGFVRLMEAMSSLGLHVTDANVTTLNGSVLNILKVEAYKNEVELKNLEDTLIKLTS